jgi:beta-glucosidase
LSVDGAVTDLQYITKFCTHAIFDNDSQTAAVYNVTVEYNDGTATKTNLNVGPLRQGMKQPLLFLTLGGWNYCNYKVSADGSFSTSTPDPNGGYFANFNKDTDHTRYANGDFDIWARQVLYQARCWAFDGIDIDYECPISGEVNALQKILAALTNPGNLQFAGVNSKDANDFALTQKAFAGWDNSAYPSPAETTSPTPWLTAYQTGALPIDWPIGPTGHPYISVTLPGSYAKVGAGLVTDLEFSPDLNFYWSQPFPSLIGTSKTINYSYLSSIQLMLYDSGNLATYNPQRFAMQFVDGVGTGTAPSYNAPGNVMPCGLSSLPGIDISNLGFGLEIVPQATSGARSNEIYPYTMDICVAQTLAAFANGNNPSKKPFGGLFIWFYDPEWFALYYPQIAAGLGAQNAVYDPLLQNLEEDEFVFSSTYELGATLTQGVVTAVSPISVASTTQDPYNPLQGQPIRASTVAPPSAVDLAALVLESSGGDRDLDLTSRSRKFLWGAGTAAFQVEGNLTVHGRGASIWDNFVTPSPSNSFYPDLACNSYFQYEDDIRLLASHGAKAYRFSIAWPRIIPEGTLYTDDTGSTQDLFRINRAGIDHYNAVIDKCRAHGLEPVITLYHWDLPNALQTKYGGWLCADVPDGKEDLVDQKYSALDELKIVADFRNYADVCFKHFGDRVKFWATINEPQTICVDCYEFNWYAPGAGTSTGVSNRGDEYRVGRNLLLAHAEAYHRYHNVYYEDQRGAVGIVCNMDCGIPFDDSIANVAAAQRSNEFWGGWFWDPIFFGQYPESMLTNVNVDGDIRLPPLTEYQGMRLRGTADVFFWNTYSANLIQSTPRSDNKGWSFDSMSNPVSIDAKGFTIGLEGASTWLHSVPEGAAAGLAWIQNRYSKSTPSQPGEGVRGVGIRLYASDESTSFRKLALMVTENGFDVPNEDVHTPEHLAVNDVLRWRDYYVPYLQNLHDAAARTGVTFAGYFAWALVDNLEWTHGFNNRFGLSYINFLDSTGAPITRGGEGVRLQRVPKQSFKVLAKLLNKM